MADRHHAQSAGAQRFGRFVMYALLAVFALYYLMPLFVMLTTSLKTLDDIRTGNLSSSFRSHREIGVEHNEPRKEPRPPGSG